ncbi:ankyrin [Aspergillus sclerotioniger CBS 115572]|uniref:Ankyrin n=1 Tax=Aspergillus sclerotioniger CBS 115572 TaxID=1450535 RepID=A0A317X221_9EURO|nr:ankyrin [Aspergillus sclerotioniger CBS 115572]PWY90590.1 ankyrin [Aspergillus sclerotioniger CBS 115572]
MLLDYGVDPNPLLGDSTAWQFANPLGAAVTHGHEAIVRLLIDHGAQLEFPRQIINIFQPLSTAAFYRQTAMVKLLLEHGCNPLTRDYQSQEEMVEGCAWTTASPKSLETLQLFIDHGVRPDFSDPDFTYHQSIRIALWDDDIALVKFLFDHGAQLELPTDPQWEGVLSEPQATDILYEMSTAAGKFPDYAPLLLEKIKVDEIIEEGTLQTNFSIMMGAATGGCEHLARRSLNIDWVAKFPNVEVEDWRDFLSDWLRTAARLGHLGIVRLLFDHGASTDDTRGEGPPIFSAVTRKCPEMVELFLDRGVDPFVKELRGSLFDKIIVQCAGSEACLKMVQQLVDRDLLAPKGTDIARLIARAVRGGTEVFKLVVDHLGIALHPSSWPLERAFVEAVKKTNTEIMEMFLKAGFDPNFRRCSTKVESYLAMAAEAWEGLSLHERAVDLLLNYGADINWRKNIHDMTPLLCVASMMSYGSEARPVRLLLKKGADPFCSYKDGETLLERVAKLGNLPTLKAILEHFDEQNTPFSRVKVMVEKAVSEAGTRMSAQYSWRWYWRRVYPCPGDDTPF